MARKPNDTRCAVVGHPLAAGRPIKAEEGKGCMGERLTFDVGGAAGLEVSLTGEVTP